MAILLQNALALSEGKPYSFSRKDVWIGEDGKIGKVEKAGLVKMKKRASGGAARKTGKRPDLDPKKSGPVSSSIEEKLDCSRKILLPGLINAHTHASMSLLRAVADDLPLQDWIHEEMRPRQIRLTPADVKTGAKLAMAEMIRSGTTCFNDHYFHMDAVMEAAEETGMRACLGYSMIDMGDYDGAGRSELKIAREFAGKVICAHDPLITASIDPHAPNTCSPQLLRESAALAKEMDCILHTHAAETRAELAFTLKNSKKRPIQLLDDCGCLGPKTILAHGVYVSKSEVGLIAKKGASLAHCPVSNLKLANGGAAPIPEYLAAGANVALGTDGAASNNSLDLFESMKVGAIEQKNFRFDPTAVTADDYLCMATEGGAKALGIKAGKISPGYAADLVLLDGRAPNLVPFQNHAGWLAYAAGPQNVTDVMVAGKWLMREKELVTLDEEKIMDEAQRIAGKLG
ncbi:MAG: amidohydrolase [Candidatus Micrarchaeota archaeon]